MKIKIKIEKLTFCARWDSNPRPLDYATCVLTTIPRRCILHCFYMSSNSRYSTLVQFQSGTWNRVVHSNSKLIGIKLSFTKFVCTAIVRWVWKSSMHIQTMRNFFKISWKIYLRYRFKLIFIIVVKSRLIKTRFLKTKSGVGDWLSIITSRILFCTVTFGFIILIGENDGSQNFIDNWLSEERKFWRISLLSEWTM